MKSSGSYTGAAVPFSQVSLLDDYLHPVDAGAPFDTVETNLYGFNIPEKDIQCNIYVLWHPVFRCMSMHIFVFQGARFLDHHLQADYFNESLYLPAVEDISEYRLRLGTCDVRIAVVDPLKEIHLQYNDPQRQFSLDLVCTAAMPPVGRPGGKHFTQLMKTAGELVLDGRSHAINGHYMRDRSWGYSRPEAPERTPPYRWITGWFGDDCGFVLAWIDTDVFDAPEFGPNWHQVVSGKDGSGANKWESGGATPSLNLRSGWFAVDGEARPVVRMDVTTHFADSCRRVQNIELVLEDSHGDVHRVCGKVTSMIPKMYWQTMITLMHAVTYTYQDRTGNGDLMDTYSYWHLKDFQV